MYNRHPQRAWANLHESEKKRNSEKDRRQEAVDDVTRRVDVVLTDMGMVSMVIIMVIMMILTLVMMAAVVLLVVLPALLEPLNARVQVRAPSMLQLR